MIKSELPSNVELSMALSDNPLGQGSEAVVYKIHTSPQFTMRISRHLLQELKSQNLMPEIQRTFLDDQKNIKELLSSIKNIQPHKVAFHKEFKRIGNRELSYQ